MNTSKITLEEILKIINEANPLGLYVDDESNPDEFLAEAKEIEKRLANISSEVKSEDVKHIVNDVFYSYFQGVEIKNEELDKIVDKLHKRIR